MTSEHKVTVDVLRHPNLSYTATAVCICGWQRIGPTTIEAEDWARAHRQEMNI